MKILIIQLKRLGDVVLTTPLIARLRERIPQAQITLALDASARSLAPLVDHDRALFRGEPGFWPGILRGGYDVVLDVTGNDRSALLAAISRSPRRVTWRRFAKKPFRRLVYNAFADSSVKLRHTADHHTDLLAALGISTDPAPSRLVIPEAADAEAGAILEKKRISAPFAIIHPGTARPEKYWTPQNWSEVAAWLRSRMPVVITGGSDAAERRHIDEIQADAHDLAGKLPLPVTAALIARAKIVCAVDSLPVHLADALGIPVVALFGPTNPFHWRPRRSSSRIVTASGVEPVAPNHPKGPMASIEPSRVIRSIEELL